MQNIVDEIEPAIETQQIYQQQRELEQKLEKQQQSIFRNLPNQQLKKRPLVEQTNSFYENNSNILPDFSEQKQEMLNDELQLLLSCTTDKVAAIHIKYISFNGTCSTCNLQVVLRLKRNKNNNLFEDKCECCCNKEISISMKRRNQFQENNLYLLADLKISNCINLEIHKLYVQVECQCKATSNQSRFPIWQVPGSKKQQNRFVFIHDEKRFLCNCCSQEVYISFHFYKL